MHEGDVTIPRIAPSEPLRRECDHFLECLTSGAKPIADGWKGLEVVRVLEAISRSVGNDGRMEQVDP